MSTVTFDTLEFVKTLQEAGMPPAHAEAVSMAVRKAQDRADVATKDDVTGVRSELVDLRKDMEIMRRDIIIKLGGMLMLGFVSIIGLLFKLLG